MPRTIATERVSLGALRLKLGRVERERDLAQAKIQALSNVLAVLVVRGGRELRVEVAEIGKLDGGQLRVDGDDTEMVLRVVEKVGGKGIGRHVNGQAN